MPTKAYNAIDSHTDAVEGWSKFGADEEGVEPMLREGVGALGALASEPQQFRLFSGVDQRQILEEIEENPQFGAWLKRMLHTHGGVSAISESARRAALNELDGSFPEMKGTWTSLRRRLRGLVREIPRAIGRQIGKMNLSEKTQALRALVRGDVAISLGADTASTSTGDVWGALVGSITTAAASIYTAKLQNDAKKDIAKIESRTAASQVAYQSQLTQAQAALDEAKAQAAARQSAGSSWGGGSGGSSGGGMSPMVWAVPLGIGVLGFGLWMFLKKG
jgi:hypothetical protein